MTIHELAKKLCDRERRKHPHLKFFLDDGPCKACLVKAEIQIAKDRRLAGAKS